MTAGPTQEKFVMITCDVKGPVARVTMRRAEQGNALTTDLVRKLRDVFRKISGVPIATLSGDGPDFCLGRDRNEPKTGTPYDAFNLVSGLNGCVSEYQGILIAAVRGRAHGLGVGLVMRSDLAIASDNASFALDEVKHAIPPMFIMSVIGDHLAPKHALDAVLTGRELDASAAMQMGLVSRVVPASSLDASVDTLVNELATRDPAVLFACKRYFRTVRSLPDQARAAFALVEQANFATAKH
jgi:enoyl-CoA hydratase/carnithine racemase